jgi:hypothetical protein
MGTQTDDRFISITREELVALQWINIFFKGNGHLYTISATSNLIDVDLIPGKYNPFPNKEVFVAKGSIPWTRVMTANLYFNGEAWNGCTEEQFRYFYAKSESGGCHLSACLPPAGERCLEGLNLVLICP